MFGRAAAERCLTCRTCNNECAFEAKVGTLKSVRSAPSFALPGRPTNLPLKATESGLLVQEFHFPHFHGKRLKSSLVLPRNRTPQSNQIQSVETLVELKTAYLIAFARLGYSYILDPSLHIVRNAILANEPIHCCATFSGPDDPILLNHLAVVDVNNEPAAIVRMHAAHPVPPTKRDTHVVLLPRPGSSPNVYETLGLASELTSALQNIQVDFCESGAYKFPAPREVPRHWDHPCSQEEHQTSTATLAVVEFDCTKHGPERLIVVDPPRLKD